MARKAGPIIDEIVARLGSLQFTIKGRNLSKAAGIRIGDEEIKSDQMVGGGLRVEDPDADASERGMASVMHVTIREPKLEWLRQTTELTITNPDGQRATWPFEVAGLAIVKSIEPNEIRVGQLAKLKVEGRGFERSAIVGDEDPAPLFAVINSMTFTSEKEVVWYSGSVHHLPRAEDGESVNGLFPGRPT